MTSRALAVLALLGSAAGLTAHPGHEHAGPLAAAAEPLAGPDHALTALVVLALIVVIVRVAMRLRAAGERRRG